MTPTPVVLLLALLLGLQPVTTDLYLPALPALTADFGVPVHRAQLTLTVLLLAFGSSQLVWGPLSDRFGRKPVLVAGLSLYGVAALLSVLAPSMDALIVWRGLQGAAMGAAVMGARAIVRDLYAPAEGARAMARALGGLGLIACASPPLGGWLASSLGWRAALGLVAAFGALTLALVAWRFHESLPPARRAPLRLGAVLRANAQVLRHPGFWAWCALVSCSYAGLFTFLAASPFVFREVHGFSARAYGLVLAATASLYFLGTLLCRWLLPHLGLRRTAERAALLSLAGGGLMALLALAGFTQWWAFLLPHGLFMLGHGIHQPCAQTGAVAPFPHSAGTASALNGFLMMCVAFGVGHWLGWRMDGTVFPLVHGVAFWSVGIALAAWFGVRRHGDVRPAEPATPPPTPAVTPAASPAATSLAAPASTPAATAPRGGPPVTAPTPPPA